MVRGHRCWLAWAAGMAAVVLVPATGAAAPKKGCVDCHPKHAGAAPHQPVPGDPCLFCHAPHASADPDKGDKAPAKACGSAGCHDKKVAPRPDVTRHEPFTFGWCTMCHEHGSSFLKPPVDTQIALCLNCHDRAVGPSAAAGLSEANAVSVHPPRGKGAVACTFCHGHHESPRHFGVPAPDGKGTVSVANPKRLTAPERELCAKCHRNVGSHHVAPNSAMIEERSAAARAIPCGTCHEAHYAAFPHLMKTNRSKAEMCASCHRAPTR